ncbi:hypothetical protein LAD12857_20310 [Lacrimispora amygdalina]|uniref:Uncharacterized protein n=1 Tax=Lacrimispora amygdalina TaxID=253257 RepID=A0ABQ5M5A0_9FIRM
MADQNEMLEIVTPMMEHVCDHLCRFPWEIERKEDLEEVCAGCQMGKHVCEILNTYNAACKLQAAAGIVRSELLQKGDWYNALVESIYRYLRKAGYITSWDQMARELADRIVGIEPEQEGK